MAGMKPGMMMVMDKISRYERTPRSEYGGDPDRRMIGYDRDYPTENRRRRDFHGRYMEGGGNSYNRDYERGTPHMGGYAGEYDDRYGMDEPENRRRRDSRGRYMNGGDDVRNGRHTNYPWSEETESNYATESRRRRDSRGRYMEGGMNNRMGGDYDEDDDMRSQTWYPPHGNMPQANMYPMNMHGASRYGFGDVYADVYAPGAMNRPTGNMGGMMGGDMSQPVDEHTARMWVQKMDGGEHFKPEQAEPLRATHCPDCGKWEWYTAMNAMYSDYCETAKKMGVDKPEFYAGIARDFLKDKDAKSHKLRRYMEHIAK
jgi:RNA polymerase subunit RPABC4/transcription elongation factor Spt4